MSDRQVLAAAALAAVAVTTVTAAGVALAAHRSGFRYGGSTPVLVLSLTVATGAVFAAAAVVVRRGQRLLGRWLLATAVSVLAYLVFCGGAAGYAGERRHRNLLAQVLVLGAEVGHVLPILLLQLCVVAAVRGLSGPPSRWLVPALLAYSTGYALLEAVLARPDPPFTGLVPVWDAPGLSAVTWVTAVPWMASVLLGPVLAWRALPRSRPEVRQRMLVVALVSVAPIATIVFCVLSGLLAYAVGVVSVQVGEAGLAVAFGLPFVLCPAGLAVALGGADLGRVTAARATAALTVMVGVPLVIVVVAVSAVVGTQFGAGALLPVVFGTLVVGAVFAPLRRRLVRALVLRIDPVRARAAVLVQSLDADSRADPATAAQRILRAALREPDARLLLRLPENRGWVDVDGLPATPQAPPAGPAHLETAGMAAGALAEAGPLIDQAVLAAAVRDQAARLGAERERAEEAAGAERRRLERDLHDGVQGRLLALALDLRMAQRDLGDGDAQLVLSDAVDGLTTAIDELRALAAGTTPELLSRHGLRAALVELTRRMPVPITVSAPGDRLPPPVEIVAYLVICEAVTNAVKHAAASTVTVDVTLDGGVAVVAVSDDGRGGADLRAGTGLRGLSERVSAAGGALVVSDRRPQGTTLEVTLPCGS